MCIFHCIIYFVLYNSFLGGGFALSDAVKVSGLSDWLGIQLEGLKVLPQFATLVIVCVMTAIVTEVASNTATANILLPVLAKMVTYLYFFQFIQLYQFFQLD